MKDHHNVPDGKSLPYSELAIILEANHEGVSEAGSGSNKAETKKLKVVRELGKEEAEKLDPTNFPLVALEKAKWTTILLRTLALLVLLTLASLMLTAGVAGGDDELLKNLWKNFASYEVLTVIADGYFNFVAAVANPGVVLAVYAVIFFLRTDILGKFEKLSEGAEREPIEDSLIKESNKRLIFPETQLKSVLLLLFVVPILLLLVTMYSDLDDKSNNFVELYSKCISSALIALASLLSAIMTSSAVNEKYFGDLIRRRASRDEEKKKLREAYAKEGGVVFRRKYDEGSTDDQGLVEYLSRVQDAQAVLGVGSSE